MDHEYTKNIYDDGNIPDSDLPERSNPSNGQSPSGNTSGNGYNAKEQNGYYYNTDNSDNNSSPQQAPLTWVTPPVLLAEKDNIEPNAPGIL